MEMAHTTTRNECGVPSSGQANAENTAIKNSVRTTIPERRSADMRASCSSVQEAESAPPRNVTNGRRAAVSGANRPLLPSRVLLVLEADEFHEIGVRHERRRDRISPRFCVRL